MRNALGIALPEQTRIKSVATLDNLKFWRDELRSWHRQITRQDGELIGDQGEEIAHCRKMLTKFITQTIETKGLLNQLIADQQSKKKDIDTTIRNLRKVIDQCNSALLETVSSLGSQKVGDASLSVRTTQEVVITDENALPDSVIILKRVPDKKKIGELLKSGKAVAGAELKINHSPNIR